jgi:dihydrofolate reductase
MKAIIACDPNGGIGYQNKLPWDKIQGDLPRFKKLTLSKVVVMGRNTWESLPVKPLSNRLNIVLSSTPFDLPNGAFHITNLDQLNGFDGWIIGGSQLIQSAWNRINEVHLTRTFTEYPCDTFIDIVKLEYTFEMVSEEIYSDHAYQIWKRR